MSSVFRTKNLQDTAGIDNAFFLEKSCRKMYAIFSAVQRQQRKSDVMTSFGLAACSAVYYPVTKRAGLVMNNLSKGFCTHPGEIRASLRSLTPHKALEYYARFGGVSSADRNAPSPSCIFQIG
jgi:hypothetical protein